MFIDSLTDQELVMLIVALKYWRTNRRDTATRRNDPVLTREAIDLLIGKLGSAARSPLPSDDRAADLSSRE